MFNNVEKRIKILANVLFWLATVGCVILAFLLGWDRSHRYAEFLPEYFFAFLIGGPIDAYILAGLVYLAADAAENIKVTRDKTKEIHDIISIVYERQVLEIQTEKDRISEEKRKIEKEKEQEIIRNKVAAEKEREQREREQERERKNRFDRYWSEHEEEKQALLQKRSDAAEKLKQLGNLAAEEKAVLQSVIEKIDDELNRER